MSSGPDRQKRYTEVVEIFDKFASLSFYVFATAILLRIATSFLVPEFSMPYANLFAAGAAFSTVLFIASHFVTGRLDAQFIKAVVSMIGRKTIGPR